MNGTYTLLKNMTDRRGRIYAREDLERCVVGKTIMGELAPGEEMNTIIDLAKVSHTVKNIRFVDNDLVGDVELLNTPAGATANSLRKEGVNLTSSIRALGRVSEDMTVSDLEVFAFDLI
jgi:hypothetical protein